MSLDIEEDENELFREVKKIDASIEYEEDDQSLHKNDTDINRFVDLSL
jgi:hypothetical protein